MITLETKPNYKDFNTLESFVEANNIFLESIGFDADTLADLRSRGINTPKDLAKDEAINSYVDTCKAVEGYSPSTEGLSLEALENKITELRRYINEGGY